MSRISDNLLYDKTQTALTRTRNDMLKNQEMAASGKRINRASDDPVGIMHANRLKSANSRVEAVTSNLDYMSGMLLVTDTALAELTEIVTRSRELAVQMSSSTNQDPTARESMAKEVDQLLERAVQIGNSRFGDRYIFGGYQSNQPPFDTQGAYRGDDGQVEIEIDGGSRLVVNVTGRDVLLGGKPQHPNAGENSPTPKNLPESSDIRGPASQDNGELRGVNILATMKNFSEGLRQGGAREAQATLDDFEASLQQVIAMRTTVGAKQNSLDRALDSLSTTQYNNSYMLSETQDSDTVKVFSDMARQEHVLTATMKTNEKLITPTLLDFLR